MRRRARGSLLPFALAAALLPIVSARPARAQAIPATLTAEIREALAGLGSEDPLRAADAEVVLLQAGSLVVLPLLDAIRDRAAPPRLAAHAARILGEIGDRRATLALKRALRDATDEGLRLACAVALCRLGDKEGVPPLIELLASGDRERRLEASIALLRFTHQDFGFRFDGPPGERTAAIERWRRWWRQSGGEFSIVGAER